ncbi:ATP-dependent DNA helicase RecG [Herbivorax sp. ANBcel31]|uniref:ATP-dependent DNA helicase RecG n=1 Tax=Herbivorax sp. ANBcel31 TaxID=3069754 RepID=UPI0027B35F31|nr:ATP-dependent DNA helicase RecG [Herbivorax sp. ANBcel31]MDQ2085029.1 ATP-dependent DNA helicase RecG [Herbivorax sp. ANBcel31]
MSDVFNKAITVVKGIGATRAKLFNKLGIFNVEDLIFYYPRDYEDRSHIKKIAKLEDGEKCAFIGVIDSRVREKHIRRGLSIYQVSIRDDTGRITAIWYNQHFIKKIFRLGARYIFYGTISKKFNSFEVQNAIYEREDKKDKLMGIVPVYPSTKGLSQNIIRSSIKDTLELTGGKIEEVLPCWIKNKYNLADINYSISNIHFPKSDDDFIKARYRLVFEELFLLQLALLSIKNTLDKDKEGIEFGVYSEKIEKFIKNIGFPLTNAQKKVFEEIKNDMERPKVMNRLVQGDVGSGKTIVAIIALYKAVISGYQGALMAPTEILARQHFESVQKLFLKEGIKVDLLVGSQTPKEKRDVLRDIENGKTDVVIGTHAIIQENVNFFRLGIVITDEQHRFGVRQRTVLSNKGENPDIIVMTATPIPRTLALILYGDLDVSIIDELPPGRKPVETYAVDNSMRERINKFIRKKVLEGRQVYIVCPLIEESDSIEAKSAEKLADKIKKEDFKDLRVGLIHGKMSGKDKDNVMEEFLKGDIDILVSTTVIEVGVNVANAAVMVVENSERFGMSQLHQLRGRVGRSIHKSYCILYNEGKGKVAKERMKVMEKNRDGFVISQKDLELRGPGEFFGTRQHGIPQLKIANLYNDMDVLKKAQDTAINIIDKDRNLSTKEHLLLKNKIKKEFKEKINILSLN